MRIRGSGKRVVELEAAAGLTTTHSQEQVAVGTVEASSSSGRKKRSYRKLSSLTQEEIKEKNARRKLAKRQSAKRYNLRQKALDLKLKNQVADLLQEKERLDKEIELALKDYNSLCELIDHNPKAQLDDEVN